MRPISVDSLEYFFGTGDGELSTWHDPPDLDVGGDGVLDAVALDFDGDGRIDDAMWDSDGDGRADTVLLDLDDDGVAESAYADGGRGLWELPVAPSSSARSSPAQPEPPGPARLSIDNDGDGRTEQILEDTDGDGYADRAVSP